MKLGQFLKDKLNQANIKIFFRLHRVLIGLAIFIVALVYGGFLIYLYAFQPIWFPQNDFEIRKTFLNLDLYNDVFEDFLDRSVRLEEGMNKIYNDPFR